MAKKTKANIVNAMETSDLLNIDPKLFKTLDQRELSKVVSRLSSMANKRMNRFTKSGESSPAFRSAQQSGGNFGAKGKNLNQLRHEYIRVNDFLTSESSTIKGWLKVQDQIVKKLQKAHVPLKQNARAVIKNALGKDQYKKLNRTKKGKKQIESYIKTEMRRQLDAFFRVYENVKSVDPSISNRNLKYTVMKEMTDYMVQNPNLSVNEVSENIANKVSDIYEQNQKLLPGDDISSLL